MPAGERDAFEEHFFSCKACGEDVHVTSMFIQNAKAVFAEEDPNQWHSREAGWRRWFRLEVAIPAFAALALAAVIAYQNEVVIPGLMAPKSMVSAVILDGATRSSGPALAAGKPLRFQISVDRPGSGSVLVEIEDSAGKVVRTGAVDELGPGGILDVYFPGALTPGNYTLVVKGVGGGAAGQELTHSQFQVVR